MTKLMLIDATHPEETRVAVVANGQIEDFDFEARNKRQLRGNIYLAKVTRVEPSLQAAFVEYGGNRHGFLAFGEIHPDYYQIPKEDRDALLAEVAAAEEEADDDVGAGPEASGNAAPEAGAEEGSADDVEGVEAEAAEAETTAETSSAPAASDSEEDDDDEDDALARRRAALFQRKYKIQEVIRRRQVMLVQVVKEERGNKGAALTTYLSLAGRYCVLMPNTSRAGGVSRKITNSADRKRLKAITAEFEIPRGAGLIVRTAGAKRTKTEIRRDFEYLTKLWQQIVGRTMESMAPSLIHEEGHLVLRAVRDLYDKDVQQIIVDGEQAFREAKTFVEMLMPSHARKVVLHEGSAPLFVATGVEDQLESIFSPTVRLPSGGYIVINQTEALVAIDVNSGKATRERNVESTALRTNLEAASEACRQMRLRDLAGLIVIDFIDMEESKNIRQVERRMADGLKIDRARVQTGRISQFGLFEISRQRRRAGVLELTSEPCPHCAGAGRVRSIESAALQVLRMIEARASDDRVDTIHVQASANVALYILNEKRASIAEIENDNHVTVRIEANPAFKAGECEVEGRADGQAVPYKLTPTIDLARLKPIAVEDEEETLEDEEIADEDETAADADGGDDAADDDDGGRRRRRGRRGGRRRRRDDGLENQPAAEEPAQAETEERGGRRRRRRDRDSRPRVPDIAADGGEMLDAIASAPFLVPAAEIPPETAAGEPTRAAEPVEEPPVETGSEAHGESSSIGGDAPDFMMVEIKAEPSPPEDHEIAATAPEGPAEATDGAASSEADPEPSPGEALRRHPIHDVGQNPPSEPGDKPRRAGWWSRKRA